MFNEKEFIELILSKTKEQYKDESIYERVEKEIEILKRKNMLRPLFYLYKYKNETEYKYYFNNMINNILVLYILGLSSVNPLEYNLPYELFNDSYIHVKLIEPENVLLEEEFYEDGNFTFVKCILTSTGDYFIDRLEDNYYVIIPNEEIESISFIKKGEYDRYETNETYHVFIEQYPVIKIDEISLFREKEVSIKRVIDSDFLENIKEQLQPQTLLDYSKLVGISKSTGGWIGNQELSCNSVKTLISTREDVFEILLNHLKDRELSLKITEFIRKGKTIRDKEKWNEYKELLLKNNVSNSFIEIVEKIYYLSGRGECISICNIALDKDNYYVKYE